VEGGGAGDSSRFGALGGFPGDLICAGEVVDDEADSEAVRGGGDAARPLPTVPPTCQISKRRRAVRPVQMRGAISGHVNLSHKKGLGAISGHVNLSHKKGLGAISGHVNLSHSDKSPTIQEDALHPRHLGFRV
jgi:hypothetical protein